VSDRRSFLRSASAAAGLALAPSGLAGAPRAERHVSGYGSVGGEPVEPLDILILGGTSFLGPRQVHLALERGHSVSVFNRGQTQPRMFVDDFERVEWLVGDRGSDLQALARRSWDVVIDNSTREAAWAEASVALLRETVGRYVFISSTGVYYPYRSTGLDEDAPVALEDTRGGDDGSMTYGVMKAKGEEAVRRGFGERAVILRPGHIVGPGDTQPGRFVYWTSRMQRGGEVFAPGRRSDPTQLVDVRDLTGFLFHLVEGGVGGTFNVVGPAAPMPMEEFLHGMRACTGRAVTWVWADDHDWLRENRLTGFVPWVLPVGDEIGHMSVDAGRALAAGLTLRPLARTAFDVMAWWDAEPEEVRSAVRFPLTPEREREVIEAWRARGPA